jgi:hypothetical protein
MSCLIAMYRKCLHNLCVLSGVTDASTKSHKIALRVWVVVYVLLTSLAVHVTFLLGLHASRIHDLSMKSQHNTVPMALPHMHIVYSHDPTFNVSTHADFLQTLQQSNNMYALNAFVVAFGLTLLLVASLTFHIFLAFQVNVLRELATHNTSLVKLGFMRYVQVPGVLSLSVALLSGVTESHFGSRAVLVTFVVFQMIQLSVWLFDLVFEVREPLRYAATNERQILQRLHYASLIVHFSTACFLIDLFVRRITMLSDLQAGHEDVLLFLSSIFLWGSFVFTHCRLNTLSSLFESVWPGSRVCEHAAASEAAKTASDVEDNALCGTVDGSTVVLRDSTDQRIYTIRLDADFDAYAYLHKPNAQLNETDGMQGMHIARVGAGPRIFDATFTDNEQSTRSVIGRVTLWRLVWPVQLWCVTVFALCLYHICQKKLTFEIY